MQQPCRTGPDLPGCQNVPVFACRNLQYIQNVNLPCPEGRTSGLLCDAHQACVQSRFSEDGAGLSPKIKALDPDQAGAVARSGLSSGRLTNMHNSLQGAGEDSPKARIRRILGLDLTGNTAMAAAAHKHSSKSGELAILQTAAASAERHTMAAPLVASPSLPANSRAATPSTPAATAAQLHEGQQSAPSAGGQPRAPGGALHSLRDWAPNMATQSGSESPDGGSSQAGTAPAWTPRRRSFFCRTSSSTYSLPDEDPVAQQWCKHDNSLYADEFAFDPGK